MIYWRPNLCTFSDALNCLLPSLLLLLSVACLCWNIFPFLDLEETACYIQSLGW